MLIRINADWQLKTDEHQWILQQRVVRKQAQRSIKAREWRNRGYFGSLSSALQRMVSLRVFAIEGEFDSAALGILADALSDIRLDIARALESGKEAA